MIRTLWFALKVAVLIALAYWLAERPGEVSVTWLGYRIDTSVGILLLALAVLIAIASVAYYIWRSLRRAPKAMGQGMQNSRRKRGYKALTQGMVAVAAGEADEAARHAKRADSLLDEPPLTMLLSAQAAQLNGDEAAAKRYFSAMLENPETRFLGLRGLLTQALREGDQAAALDYVRQAHSMRPRTPWVLNSLFDLSERGGDFASADRALSEAAKFKALPAPEAARKRAVVALERAQDAAREGNSAEALRQAREANKLAPDLVPAAQLLAEQLLAKGQRRKALKVLGKTWTLAPHPDLAALYLSAQAGGGGGKAGISEAEGLTRLKSLGALTAARPDHPESHLALARAALDARLWGEARRHLKRAAGPGKLEDGLEGNDIGETVCRLMARLEERENDDREAAHAWLARAARAPKDPAWTCTACGAVSPAWSARCGACEGFDTLAWQPPPRVAAALLEAAARRSPVLEHQAERDAEAAANGGPVAQIIGRSTGA